MMIPDGVKIPQSASPLAREGAGDSSADRGSVHSTPPARRHPAHPKKQIFSVPVNKFTAKSTAPSSNLVRIRSCLDEYRRTPARPVKIGPKAVSMEDLTPTKKIKSNRKEIDRPRVHSSGLRSVAEEEAVARIGRFMLVATWRRRREEIRCLRKTLEFQVTCSERLRIQVCALKSLLDSDNAKVRLAMRELERLKQLLRDKDMEKAVLEREKFALEQDVCAAEDRASEMNINWRNSRNELEMARVATAACERALANERAAAAEARAHCDRAFAKLAAAEEELSQHEVLVSSLQGQRATLRRERDEVRRQLARVSRALTTEQEAREHCSRECSALSARVALQAREADALRGAGEELRERLRRTLAELQTARERLDWWPRPLTAMLGVARSWFRRPMSLPEAVLWSAVPARHGC